MKKLLIIKMDGATGYEILYAGDEKIGIILGGDPVLDTELTGHIEKINNDLFWVTE